jgi:hypothetical protein
MMNVSSFVKLIVSAVVVAALVVTHIRSTEVSQWHRHFSCFLARLLSLQ